MERLRGTSVLFAVVVALLVGQSSTRPQPDEIEDMKKALRAACGSKYPITEESRINAQKGVFVEDRNFKDLSSEYVSFPVSGYFYPEPSPKRLTTAKYNMDISCFIMCALDEFSLIDEEANIDGETLISMVPDNFKSAIEDSVKKCLPMEAGKPDTCDVSYNFLTCGAKSNPKLIEFLPF